MTAKELAEKILKVINPAPAPDFIVERVEALLTAALEEAVTDYRNHGSAKELKEDWKNAFEMEIRKAKATAYEEGYTKGWKESKYNAWVKWQVDVKEAYEECAKIAEEGPPAGGFIHCNGDVRDPGVVVTGFQKWIAAKIRQRAQEVGKSKTDEAL